MITLVWGVLHFVIMIIAFSTTQRDPGYVWMGITSALLAVMFLSNVVYLSGAAATSAYLDTALFIRNLTGSAGLVSVVITAWMVLRYDKSF